MSKIILFSLLTIFSILSFSQTDVNNLFKEEKDYNYFNKRAQLYLQENDSSYFTELIFAIDFKNNRIDSIYTIFSNDSILKNEKNIKRVIIESERKWNYEKINNKTIIMHFSLYRFGIDRYYNKDTTIPFFDFETQKQNILNSFTNCIFLENIKSSAYIACLYSIDSKNQKK